MKFCYSNDLKFSTKPNVSSSNVSRLLIKVTQHLKTDQMFMSKLSLDWYNPNIYSSLFQNIYLLLFVAVIAIKKIKYRYSMKLTLFLKERL